jgi:hypothetical protein
MTATFSVTDKYELQALHRVLFQAQFPEQTLDRYVPGSPLLADMANRLVDVLTTQDSRWSEWRAAEKHPDKVSIAERHLTANPLWSKMSRQERVAQVHNQLAPLVPSNELVSKLVGDEV